MCSPARPALSSHRSHAKSSVDVMRSGVLEQAGRYVVGSRSQIGNDQDRQRQQDPDMRDIKSPPARMPNRPMSSNRGDRQHSNDVHDAIDYSDYGL